MSSFLSNLASGTSTREVVEELERTRKKLEKSQTRLTKLSGAYKALQEEKKTLEATISAISGPSQGFDILLVLNIPLAYCYRN